MEKPSSGNSGFVLGKGGVHHKYNRWLTGVFFLCKHPHWGPLSREELQPRDSYTGEETTMLISYLLHLQEISGNIPCKISKRRDTSNRVTKFMKIVGRKERREAIRKNNYFKDSL